MAGIGYYKRCREMDPSYDLGMAVSEYLLDHPEEAQDLADEYWDNNPGSFVKDLVSGALDGMVEGEYNISDDLQGIIDLFTKGSGPVGSKSVKRLRTAKVPAKKTAQRRR